MDRFAALRSFCLVIEHGSFSAAAETADVTHTMISRQVRSLEQRLGVQLLNRTTRHTVPTEAGRDYYAHARQILADLDAADLMAVRHQAAPRGLLRVHAPVAFGAFEVAAWLPRFLERHPEVKVELACSDDFADLLTERFDVALRLAYRLPDSALQARKIGESPLMLVAAPAYLVRHAAPDKPEELRTYNCLLYTLAAAPDVWTFLRRDGGAQDIAVSGSLRANTSIALRAAARSGAGIAAIPAFLVRDDLARGDLVAVLPDHPMPSRSLFAVYPRNRHLSPKVRAFIDFAVETYERPALG